MSSTSDAGFSVAGVEAPNIIAAISNQNGHRILATEPPDSAKADSKLTTIPILRSIPLFANDSARISKIYSPKSLDYITSQPGARQPNIHIIISTGSGTGLAQSFYTDVLSNVLHHLSLSPDTDYEVHITSSTNSVAELTHSTLAPRANQGTKQRVVLLAGDGGVVDLLNALFASTRGPSYVSPDLVIIPLGTGNALANSSSPPSFNAARDRTLGLAALARGTPKPIPTFRAMFSPGARLLTNEGREEVELEQQDGAGNPLLHGAVVASWGLHASLVADSDTAEYRKFGAERFAMAAKEALHPEEGGMPHAYRGRVSVLRGGAGSSGAKWEALARKEHAYVLGTMVRELEKGFTISPDSKPLEGTMRLVHFGPMPGEEVMRVMGLAYQDGKHVGEAEVGYEAVEGLRVEFDEEDARWRRVCIDGSIVRVEQGGWVEVRMEPERVMNLVTLDE